MKTRFVPIGGVGEFGANCAVIQTETTTILVDYGLMFPPDARKPGVDYYVVDAVALLREFPTIDALFLTHGHEDHIGGLPHLLPHRNIPMYTLPYTARLIKQKFLESPLRPLIHEAELNKPITCGDIKVSFIGVTHSIQHACSLVIETPAGRILHSGDFKLDPLPEDNHPFQSEEFQTWGDLGIDLLFMDSTNATKAGFCPSDYSLVENWEQVISRAKGRVFFTTFSSHMPRVKRLLELAGRQNRKVVFLGRSLKRHFSAATDTGYLGAQGNRIVSFDESLKLPHNQVLYITTGSQGEPRSATARILRKDYHGLSFTSSDTIIFASKPIPGNERQMALLTSDMERQGIEVVTDRDLPVHASGHAYREELAYLLMLTRPKAVIPIHGEFHHLLKHYRWLKELLTPDQDLFLIEDGDQVFLEPQGLRLEDRKPIELLPIDGNQELPLDTSTLRDRKDMMYSGLLLISLWDQPENAGSTDIKMHGMVMADEQGFLSRLRAEITRIQRTQNEPPTQLVRQIRQAAKSTLRGFFNGKPLVKCIVNGQIF